MGLFGFGKKKKTDDPVSETQKEMMQEPTAEKPDGSASGVGAFDEEELEQLYQMGLECQDVGNDTAAFQYLKQAAEGGHVLAQFTLGTIFERGSDAVYQDLNQAFYWYGLAAGQGDPGAQFNLGYLFMQSSDKQEEGLIWMKKAAQNLYRIRWKAALCGYPISLRISAKTDRMRFAWDLSRIRRLRTELSVRPMRRSLTT